MKFQEKPESVKAAAGTGAPEAGSMATAVALPMPTGNSTPIGPCSPKQDGKLRNSGHAGAHRIGKKK